MMYVVTILFLDQIQIKTGYDHFPLNIKDTRIVYCPCDYSVVHVGSLHAAGARSG